MEGSRRAAPEDLPRLAELAAEAVAEQVGGRGGAIWALREAPELPARTHLEAALDDPHRLVLAGTIDDTVVGYAVVHTEVLRNGARLGVVSAIYTEAGARDVGVGEALIDDAIAWCAERGCIGIDALALPGNRSTKNFFETFGFKARALVVHRPLSEDG